MKVKKSIQRKFQLYIRKCIKRAIIKKKEEKLGEEKKEEKKI